METQLLVVLLWHHALPFSDKLVCNFICICNYFPLRSGFPLHLPHCRRRVALNQRRDPIIASQEKRIGLWHGRGGAAGKYSLSILFGIR